MIASLLFLGVLLLYWPTRGFEFVNLDDGLYVTGNPHVQAGLTTEGLRWAFTNSDASLWHPLTWLSHMLDCQLYGLEAGGHHLTSVLLHAVNTALVFVVLTRMTNAPWPSLVVAVLFGVHPLRVESVAWVAERKDVLSGLFCLLTLWAYAQYVRTPAPQRLALVTVLFAAGLMAKPMLVTLPFVLLLLDYWPLSRVQTVRPQTLLAEKVPLLLVATLATTIAISAGRHALLPVAQMPLASRLANALIAYPSYLAKTVWPTRLAVLYPVSPTHPAENVIGSALLLAGVTILAVVGGRRFPYLPVGWFWFIGMLVPVIGLLQAGVQTIADRFTYIPSIGLLILLVWGSADLFRRWRVPASVVGGVAIFAVGTLVVISRVQLAYWRDSSTLLAHAVGVTSSNWLAHNNLGYALDQQGKVEEAIAQYRAALEIEPAYPAALNNLGVSLAEQGKLDEAIAAYRAAVGIKPDYFTSLNNLGELLLRQGKIDEAASQFTAALRAKPDYALAAHNLGTALAVRGRTDEAAEYFRTALRLKPDYADAHYNLGAALAAQGKSDEAVREFGETLAIDARYAKAHAALGNLLFRQGRWTEAVAHLREALRLNPELADAHFHLATILSQQGRADEAGEHYAAALRIQPTLKSQIPAQPE